MSANFDLDINNYSTRDLERLFSLSSRRRKNGRREYSESDIELREAEIREQFTTSGHMDKRFLADFIAFLATAKHILSSACRQELPDKSPRAIPADWRLDPSNVPASKESMPRTEELTARTKSEFVYTSPGEFFAGNLNPIAKRIETRNVCIDTIFRDNYLTSKSSDFVVTVPKPMQNVVSMQIISFELPNTWNTFSAATRETEMTIFIFNMVNYEDTQLTVTVPDGTYFPEILIDNINNQFASRGNGFQYIMCEIDKLTDKFVFRAKNGCVFDSTSPEYSPDFYFVADFTLADAPDRPLYRNLGWKLGFRHKWYSVSSDNTVNGTKCAMISECAIDFGDSRYVFVEIDDFHNNFPTDAIVSANGANGAFLGKNIIARLRASSRNLGPTLVNSSDQIFKRREFFGPVNIDRLRIRLVDKFGDVLDLCSGNFSLVLEMKQLYAQ